MLTRLCSWQLTPLGASPHTCVGTGRWDRLGTTQVDATCRWPGVERPQDPACPRLPTACRFCSGALGSRSESWDGVLSLNARYWSGCRLQIQESCKINCLTGQATGRDSTSLLSPGCHQEASTLLTQKSQPGQSLGAKAVGPGNSFFKKNTKDSSRPNFSKFCNELPFAPVFAGTCGRLMNMALTERALPSGTPKPPVWEARRFLYGEALFTDLENFSASSP